MWQAGDAQVRDERTIGKPSGRLASFEGLHVVPLIAISAKTLLSPPITYWEKLPSQARSRDQTRENSVWQNLSFTLNLRKNKANGYRYISLFCEPSPPLGIAPEFMEITWSFKGTQVVLGRVTETFVNLRISSMGARRVGPSISSPELRHKWTVIPDNLRNTLRKTDGAAGLGADGVMDLRVVVERESDIEVLKSFFAETESEGSGSLPMGDLPMGDYWRPNYDEQKADTRRRFSNSSVPTEPRAMRRESIITRSQTNHQPKASSRPSASSSEATVSAERRPQTNPHLDPNVYDPFPGMPVAGPLSASRTTAPPTSTSSPASSTSASPTPAETSQALAELQLSDGEGPTNFGSSEREGDKQADSDSSSSSSSAWSFLAKSKRQNLAAGESSSSSPSSSEPSPSPPPSPPPPPPRRIPRPIVVNSESESSDVEIVSVRENIEADGKRKKKRKSGDGSERKSQEGAKAKRKKKRREVVESSGAEDASAAVLEDQEEGGMEEEGGDEEAEVERKKKRKEKRKKKKTVDLDNDGDVEMASDEGGRSTKKKKKYKRKADSESATPVLSTTKSTAEKKGKKKGKSKVSQLQSESEGPSSRPKSSGSLKRKHFSSDGADNDESDNEEVDVKRERLKRRITEINLQKHELRVEEGEIKAMLHRLDFDSRRLDDAGIYRAHCVCSACGKYGHRKNSSICELYSGRRWR